jgi:hypothetical protein
MDRRSFLTGLGASLIAAPAIVQAASLMPVRQIVMPLPTLTVEALLAMVERCRAFDEARREVERACGIPEGYCLIFV